MKLSQLIVAVGCGSLTSASPFSLPSRTLSKRWDYDLCLNDCKLKDVPLPDKNNFQLPLEDFWSEQCPPIYIGDINAPSAVSRVCLDFIGPNLHFNFAPFPGYTTKSAKVEWKLKGNLLDSTKWNAPPPPYAGSLTCESSHLGTDFVCKLPFSTILGVSPSTPLLDVLAGICPNGDVEGLGFFFKFVGSVQSAADGKTSTFTHTPPCTKREADRSCSAWDKTCEYFELSYRCTKCDAAPACPTTPPTPTPTLPPPAVCEYGTAFGYQDKKTSYTLDSQQGQGCKRWGWYQTPTIDSLKAGISGILYVGAGKNDISKATNVGTWTAKADQQGKVTVSLEAKTPYSLDEVHIDLACLPIDKCSPGTYTFGADLPAGTTKWTIPTPLAYPNCKYGSKAALIVHAAIDKAKNGRCEPPKDDDCDDDDHDKPNKPDDCKYGKNCDDDHHDKPNKPDDCKYGKNCGHDDDDDHHGDKDKGKGDKWDDYDHYGGHDDDKGKGDKWDFWGDDDKHGGRDDRDKGKGYGH